MYVEAYDGLYVRVAAMVVRESEDLSLFLDSVLVEFAKKTVDVKLDEGHVDFHHPHGLKASKP